MLKSTFGEWHKAERYRVTAESLYRSVHINIEERKATLQPDDASLVHDLEVIKDLRMSLDEICYYQAEWAPEDYSVKGSYYPLREGRVKDLIAWRRFQSEEPQAEEGQDQMENVVGEEEASKDGEGRLHGLRPRVADFAGKMKGTSKLEKKASTQGLRRQASTMSLTNRPKWRGA